jgi:hypothetical protein
MACPGLFNSGGGGSYKLWFILIDCGYEANNLNRKVLGVNPSKLHIADRFT